jgi:hypothetical protein
MCPRKLFDGVGPGQEGVSICLHRDQDTPVEATTSGIKALQVVETGEPFFRVVEREELAERPRPIDWQGGMRFVQVVLCSGVLGRIAGSYRPDEVFGDDESRKAEREVVELSTHGCFFYTQRAPAEPVVVAEAALERTVYEQGERLSHRWLVVFFDLTWHA